jgi:hypothetical protein
MARRRSDLAVLTEGIAVLATCIVQELAKSDPTFEERFLKRLVDAYFELQDNSDYDPLIALELLETTRSLITGISQGSDQLRPFLSGRIDD